MSNITARGATGPLALTAGGTFQSSSDFNIQSLVGTRWDLSDGREVILVSSGAVAVGSPGVLCQDAALTSNHQGLAVTAFTAYSSTNQTPAQVVATLGATAMVANQYQGGYMLVDSGPGIGQTLRIASHIAYVASTSATFILEDSPNTALTTSSTVCLIPPHGANVIISPASAVTGALVGVTLYPLGAGLSAGSVATATVPANYAFLLSKGVTACLSDATAPTTGQAIIPSTSVAGAIGSASGSIGTIGYANQAATSAKTRSVFVNL